MEGAKTRDLGADEEDLPNPKTPLSEQQSHSGDSATPDTCCGACGQCAATQVTVSRVASLDSPELVHLRPPGGAAGVQTQRPSSVDDGLCRRQSTALRTLVDLCVAAEKQLVQLDRDTDEKSQTSSNSFARSLAQSSQCSEEQLLQTLNSFKIESPKLSTLPGFISPTLSFNTLPKQQQQQQQQMLQVNSLTPPFPPTYTPPGDGQKYLIPGYTILQPYQTAFLAPQIMQQQQQQQKQQQKPLQRCNKRTQGLCRMNKQYTAQYQKMNRKMEQLHSLEHAALQEHQLSKVGDVDRAIKQYFSFVPDFRTQSAHSSDQSIVFPTECSPYQGITKRCVYYPRCSVPALELMAFCSLGIARVVRDSSDRDHRKFAYHSGDKLLVIGVKQDKSRMNMLQLLAYGGSSSLALSKRADVSAEDYVLETCANESVQGPFVVSRFGCARVNSQPPGVKETRTPDTVVFEIIVDGLPIWVERSFIYTVGFQQDVEKIMASDGAFLKCDELALEDAPTRKRFADVVKRLAPIGPRVQIVKNPTTFKSKVLKSPKVESPQADVADDVEPFNGTKRTRDADACKDGKKRLGIELNDTPSPIIVPHSEESVKPADESHANGKDSAEPNGVGETSSDDGTKGIPISMLLL